MLGFRDFLPMRSVFIETIGKQRASLTLEGCLVGAAFSANPLLYPPLAIIFDSPVGHLPFSGRRVSFFRGLWFGIFMRCFWPLVA